MCCLKWLIRPSHPLVARGRVQRMIQHRSMLQCFDPNAACVRYHGKRAHYTYNSKMWIFINILKPYFHHKNKRRIQIPLDRRAGTYDTVKLLPIKSEVNSPLIITKLFQFQNFVFPTVLNGFCSLLQRLMRLKLLLNTSSLRNAWRTGLETSWGGLGSMDLTSEASFTVEFSDQSSTIDRVENVPISYKSA